MFTNKTILIIDGTGSFGNSFVPMTIAKFSLKKIIFCSRDEMMQWSMAKKFQENVIGIFDWIGVITGVSRTENSRKLNDIVNFSCCECYSVLPVKHYSCGVRLS